MAVSQSVSRSVCVPGQPPGQDQYERGEDHLQVHVSADLRLVRAERIDGEVARRDGNHQPARGDEQHGREEQGHGDVPGAHVGVFAVEVLVQGQVGALALGERVGVGTLGLGWVRRKKHTNQQRTEENRRKQKKTEEEENVNTPKRKRKTSNTAK